MLPPSTRHPDVSTHWQIRPATADDAAALSELAERTFRDAFAAFNTPGDMDLHCSRAFGPDVQAGEIADPGMCTLVAEDAGALTAFAQVRVAGEPPPCVGAPPAAELRRLYVDRRWHGSGLARELMARVLALAAEHGARALWLGVWERNPRAIQFYRSFGFSEVGEHVFVVGTDAQRDLLMVRYLED